MQPRAVERSPKRPRQLVGLSENEMDARALCLSLSGPLAETERGSDEPECVALGEASEIMVGAVSPHLDDASG